LENVEFRTLVTKSTVIGHIYQHHKPSSSTVFGC